MLCSLTAAAEPIGAPRAGEIPTTIGGDEIDAARQAVLGHLTEVTLEMAYFSDGLFY